MISFFNYITIVNDLPKRDIYIVISYKNRLLSEMCCFRHFIKSPKSIAFDLLDQTNRTVYITDETCNISLYINDIQYWDNIDVRTNQTLTINYKTILDKLPPITVK